MTQHRHLASAPSREAVLTKATLAAADRLGISGRQLALIVGVSEATVSRWRRLDSLLSVESKSFELAAIFVRIFRSIDSIAGGDEMTSRVWLTSPNTTLGARPIEMMETVQGLLNVATYLDARRAPI